MAVAFAADRLEQVTDLPGAGILFGEPRADDEAPPRGQHTVGLDEEGGLVGHVLARLDRQRGIGRIIGQPVDQPVADLDVHVG